MALGIRCVPLVAGRQVVQALTAPGAQPPAVGAAQGLEGQGGHQGVAQCRFEVQGGLPHRQEVLSLLITFGLLGLSATPALRAFGLGG